MPQEGVLTVREKSFMRYLFCEKRFKHERIKTPDILATSERYGTDEPSQQKVQAGRDLIHNTMRRSRRGSAPLQVRFNSYFAQNVLSASLRTSLSEFILYIHEQITGYDPSECLKDAAGREEVSACTIYDISQDESDSIHRLKNKAKSCFRDLIWQK